MQADCNTAFDGKTLSDESNDVINKVISSFEIDYNKKDHLEELMQPLVKRISNLNEKIKFLQDNPTSGITKINSFIFLTIESK